MEEEALERRVDQVLNKMLMFDMLKYAKMFTPHIAILLVWLLRLHIMTLFPLILVPYIVLSFTVKYMEKKERMDARKTAAKAKKEGWEYYDYYSQTYMD